MLVQVTAIEFDFETDDGVLEVEEQKKVLDSVVGTFYDVYDSEDEEELVEDLLNIISNETGWCINDLEYDIISDQE